MEEQRISKLIAEVLFGICIIGAFVCILIGAVLLTGFTNVYLIKKLLLGPVFLVIGVALAILGVFIKSAQSIIKTMRAKKEFEELQKAKQQNN